MAGRYDRINGAFCKVNKRYDRISGAWTPVKKRYGKVNGVWTQGYTGSDFTAHIIQNGGTLYPDGGFSVSPNSRLEFSLHWNNGNFEFSYGRTAGTVTCSFPWGIRGQVVFTISDSANTVNYISAGIEATNGTYTADLVCYQYNPSINDLLVTISSGNFTFSGGSLTLNDESLAVQNIDIS